MKYIESQLGHAATHTSHARSYLLRSTHSRVSLMLWPVDRSITVSAPHTADHCSFSTSYVWYQQPGQHIEEPDGLTASALLLTEQQPGQHSHRMS